MGVWGGTRWWYACWAVASVVAVPASASCFGARPTLPAVDASRPPAERVATLAARARWIEDGSEVPAWRALIVDLSRDAPADRELAAIAHAGLARALQDDASSPEMVAEATRALALAREAKLDARASYFVVLVTAVNKLVIGGRPDEAEPLVQPMLAAARREWGEHSIEYWDAVSAAGWLAYGQGRFEESLDYALIKRDLAVACLPPDDHRVVRAHVNYSVSLSSVGRLDEATAAAFAGARLAAERLRASDPAQLYALRNLGVLLTGFGRLGEAEAVLRRGVDLAARYHPDDRPARAQMISALARAVDLEGRPLDAEALWDRSLELSRGAKSKADGYGAFITLRRSADSAQRRGDLVTALARRDAALAASPLPATHPEQATLSLDRARTLAAMGRAAEAKAVGAPAFATLIKRSPINDTRVLYLTADWADIVSASDGAEAGWAILQPVTRRIEALLLDPATSRGELVNLAPTLRGSCLVWARLALQTGREEEAFRALQLVSLSSIVVASTDAANRAAATDPAERAILRALADAVISRRLAERTRSAAVTGSGGTESVQMAIERAETAIAALTAELDRRFPAYRAASRPVPVPLAAFRASLADDELLVAPLPFSTGTAIVAVTRDGLSWTTGGRSAAEVGALVERVRRSVARPDRPFDLDAARALRESVLPPPLAPLLAAHRSLLWHASGELAALPPALLAGPGRAAGGDWLIRSHAITILPSLRPTAASRTAALRPDSFLGIGAPLIGHPPAPAAPATLAFRGAAIDTGSLATLPPLAGAERELRAMQRLIGGDARVLTGAEATKATLATLPLERFRVLAFATHGLAAETVAGVDEPALVLTPPPTAAAETVDRESLLTASEIARLRLDADWVILSACDTGSGGERGAPAYAGLASAFVQAGARSLLVSHWPVRDDAAARLTVDTLDAARTAPSRAVALQRATLKLMADRSIPGAAHPALWAPFVLVGR